MKLEGSIILLIVGLTASLPLQVEKEVTDDTGRVKRGDHEVSASVSHGSNSGTSASVNYSYKWKRSPKSLVQPQEVPLIEVMDETSDAGRVKRGDHEVSGSVSHGSKSGTSASVNYSYKWKRSPNYLQVQDQIPIAEKVENKTSNISRVKRGNHEVGVSVTHGSGSGTSGMVSYSYRFKRTPENTAESLDEVPVLNK